MLFFDGGLFLLFFAVWVYCIIDVITTPNEACRNLPKLAWLLIVILLSDVGSIAWLVAGKPWASMQTNRMPYKGNTGRPGAGTYIEADRPRRAVATNPDDDEEFLAGLRIRAEEQRRRARESQPEARPAIDPKPPTDEDGSAQH